MKRFFLYLVAVVCLASCNNKDMLWMAPMGDMDVRVTNLEQLCVQMNTNISSMQTIIQALQERDYVTNVAEIKEGNEVIGYTITFAKNPSITIYKGNDGKDGKDGKDGEDGEDGVSPQIGVAKDGDVYYWTLNGEWLLDANGNKLRVTGENGKDGQDGEDGQDGADGEDGTDGVTPQFKIENDYWYISYNNGTSWTQLGKAKGADGKDGTAGMPGKDGETIFKAVDYDENFVYFTLMNDTEIKISRFSSNVERELIVDGAIMYEFSVSDSMKVYFSQGNLFYNLKTHIWKLADHQYEFYRRSAAYTDKDEEEWVDLFTYGTSGYNGYDPTFVGYHFQNYWYDYIQRDISATDYDWGYYNKISNGGNTKHQWRVLTKEEADYLLNQRLNAEYLKFGASIDGVCGLVLLPDNWSTLYIPTYTTSYSNFLTNRQWQTLESVGAIFLPAVGCYMQHNGMDDINLPYGGYETRYGSGTREDICSYWTGSCDDQFVNHPLYPGLYLYRRWGIEGNIYCWGDFYIGSGPANGFPVRLVKDVVENN